MYKYLILFVLSTPLVGIWLVERGAFAISIGVVGEPNGATEAFAIFAGLLLLVAFLSSGRRLSRRTPAKSSQTTWSHAEGNREFRQFSTRLLWLNGIFLLTMLFVFGGIHVWLGAVEKGVFRTTLGPFGALPFLMTKFVVPALFAYSTLLLMRTDQRSRDKWIWGINAILVILAGSTWGFKTTSLFMLLPGLLVLNWKLPVHRLLAFGAVFFAILMFFFFWFDAASMVNVDVFAFLGVRLTVLQGDVAWYVWGLYRDGQPLPNYWPTLLAALGDTVLSKFVSRADSVQWMSYHYDWILTYMSKSSFEAIETGDSVSGTPFAEGLIAGGGIGVALFAVTGGLLVGRTYSWLDSAIRTGRHRTAALLSTYFCLNIFPWLNSGAITQLFHISVLANLLITYGLLRSMSARRRSAVGIPSPSLS